MRLVLCILAILGGGAAMAQGASTAQYGEVVDYTEGKPLRYPDFTLVYKGKKREADAIFARGFTTHYFTVSAPDAEAEISWTSGTGDIGETPFTAGGKAFFLDLAPRKNGKFIKSGRQQLIIHDENGYNAYAK